jgi:hypothetical protein
MRLQAPLGARGHTNRAHNRQLRAAHSISRTSAATDLQRWQQPSPGQTTLVTRCNGRPGGQIANSRSHADSVNPITPQGGCAQCDCGKVTAVRATCLQRAMTRRRPTVAPRLPASALLIACVAALAHGTTAGCRSFDLHVVLMTHERTASACRVLRELAERAPRPRSVHVVVTQSAASPDAHAVSELAAALAGPLPPGHPCHSGAVGEAHEPSPAAAFGAVVHVLSPPWRWPAQPHPVPRRHVSKRNAMANLLTGLRMAVNGTHEPLQPPSTPPSPHDGDDDGWAAYWSPGGAWGRQRAHAASCLTAAPPAWWLVLEDDVTLAGDAVEYFTAAAALGLAESAAGSPHVQFASALPIFRPALLVGQNDVAFAAALQRWASPAAWWRPRERVINRVPGGRRTVFKTLAWSLTAAGARDLLPALQAAVAYDPPPAVAAWVGAATAALGQEAGPTALRSDAPLYQRPYPCPWCNDWCYDHVIEWVLQGRAYLTPAVARVSQVEGVGMSSARRNDVNAIHAGAGVPRDAFVTASLAFRVLSLFRHAGLSTWSPALPRDLAARQAVLQSLADSGSWQAALAPSPWAIASAYASEPLVAVAAAAAMLSAVVAGVRLRRQAAADAPAIDGQGGTSPGTLSQRYLHHVGSPSAGRVGVYRQDSDRGFGVRGWVTGLLSRRGAAAVAAMAPATAGGGERGAAQAAAVGVDATSVAAAPAPLSAVAVASDAVRGLAAVGVPVRAGDSGWKRD